MVNGFGFSLNQIAGIYCGTEDDADCPGLPLAVAQQIFVGNGSLGFLVVARRENTGFIQPHGDGIQPCALIRPSKHFLYHHGGNRVNDELVAIVLGFQVAVRGPCADELTVLHIGLVIGNGLSVSQFLLFFSAVGGFTAWVSGILGGFNTLHKQSLDISTVREYLEYPEPFKFENGESIEAEANRLYEIRLENVSFRYPGTDKDTLTNINLTLYPGEKLAVVGLNGAGKTTLIKLICGFLDPTEGRILLDGKDIRDYNRRDYYKMFSAVFQDFSLLAGTIATNVAQDSVGIDMERVVDCVEKAGLRKKIESLKEGYETYLNREVFEEAMLLSGGETQRLMLARALYKNAPFIVLDEPTAALDPIAESEMYQKYNELTSGKSSIYISHRLASTRFCDRIIMIADGSIVEEGTHEELLKSGGKYAALFEVQSKYYKEGESENEEN